MQTINTGKYEINISEKSDKEIPNDFLKCEQIHSSTIYLRKEGNFINQQADGIITNKTNQRIAVRVADCNAIILMGKEYFGIVHAGRKGLKNGILQNAIAILRENGEKDIKIYVGPSIRKCCYEVGPEFNEYFDKKYLISKDEKLYLDMISIIKDIANKNGIKDIVIHPDCTFCSDKYFSYRKGDKESRMIISVKKIF